MKSEVVTNTPLLVPAESSVPAKLPRSFSEDLR